MILSVCEDREDCHKDARFWMKPSDEASLNAYMLMNKLPKISCRDHFGKLVSCGVITPLALQ